MPLVVEEVARVDAIVQGYPLNVFFIFRRLEVIDAVLPKLTLIKPTQG
jgi:hypothetical protein